MEGKNNMVYTTVMFMEPYRFICGWNKHAQHKRSQKWTIHYTHNCERTLRLLEVKDSWLEHRHIDCNTSCLKSVIPVVLT